VFAGVEDYPRTLAELESRFSTEENCRAYLMALRWPEGFRCPKCGGTKSWPVGEGRLLECAACGRQTSVTAGTIFQDTRTPLRTWFRAMWWVTSQKTGASALGLQGILGFRSYQTAWAWLHKLRRAMVRPGRDRLSGTVEVDETYWGAGEPGSRGRRLDKRVLIAIAVERVGSGMGRVRIRRIPDATADSLQSFIDDAVEVGSVITTDAWLGYDRVSKRGYRHNVTFLKGAKESPSELLPRVHRVASLLKRWLLGTHQGAVRFEHLDYYLDEFTFRFNRRKSHHRGKLFYRLAQQAVAVEPVPYKRLVGGDHKI
jgi:transposase-like protein